MSSKLAMISDKVINISDTVKASMVDGKWAIYRNDELGEYEYSNVIMLCNSLVALTKPGNSEVKLVKSDFTEVFSGRPSNDDVNTFGTERKNGLMTVSSSSYLHIMAKYIRENCSPRELITAKKLPRNKKAVTNRDIDGIKLTYSIDGDMLIFRVSNYWESSYIVAEKNTMEWETNFEVGLIEITKADNGTRRVRYACKEGRDNSFITDTAGRKIVGPIKGGITKFCESKTMYKITQHYAKELVNYGINMQEIKSGIFELTQYDGEWSLKALLEDDNCVFNQVNDSLVLVAHNRKYELIDSNTKNILGDNVTFSKGQVIVDLQKDVVGYLEDESTMFIYSTRLRELRKLKGAVKITKVMFNILKILYSDGKVEYYKNGRCESSMILAYVAAKPLNTPICKEKMYGGMTSNGDWYPTSADGIPLEKEPYESFEELQEKYRNKIAIPRLYKMWEQQIL